MGISVVTTYHAHSGGTKFYEMVLLKSDLTDRALLIKRWGPVAVKKGGGQHTTERGSCAEVHQAVLDEVRKRAKRGYEGAGDLRAYGLHSIDGKNTSYPLSTVMQYASQHYQTQSYRDDIAAYFSGEDDAVPASPPAASTSITPQYEDWGLF